MTSTMDDRGRVLIPKEIREEADLGPGRSFRVEVDPDGSLRLRPVLEPREFLDRIVGAINDETRREDAEPLDPLDLKRIWEPRV